MIIPTVVGVNPTTNRIYVSNHGANTVTVIDGATNTVVPPPISVGPAPFGICVNPTTNKIYVGHGASTFRFVTVIDGNTNTVLKTISTAPGAFLNACAVNPVTNRIYVTSFDPGGRVFKIRGDTDTIESVISVAANPDGVAANPSTDCAYVGHGTFFGRTRLTIIDGASNAAFDSPVVGRGHSGIGVNPVTNRIYVHKGDIGNLAEGRPFVPFELKVLDGSPGCATAAAATANSVIDTVPLGSGTGGQVGVNAIANHIYVANQNDSTVTVIEGATNAVIATVPVGSGPFHGVGVNPETSRVYVANHGSNSISVIEDRLAVAEVAVDIKPQSCPNPLNVRARGVLPVAILGTATFDATRADPASVKLEGVPALRSALEDVARPFVPFTGKRNATDCTADGPDGFTDLTLKFDSPAVVAALGTVTDGEVRILHLTGNLLPAFGSTPIAGEDVVVIVKKR